MAIKRKKKKKASSGLKKFTAAVKRATRGITARITKKERELARLKRERMAKRKKAISGFKRKRK